MICINGLRESSALNKANVYPIYAIIVAFNPNIEDFFNNLNNMYSAFNGVLLIDNSDNYSVSKEVQLRSCKYDNITYKSLSNNGIGAAQNYAVKFLAENKIYDDILLTFFDQDSYIEKSEVLELADHFIQEKEKDENVVMLGATTNSEDGLSGLTATRHIISSGSITNLSDFEKVGFFDEDLFIDFIDFAWCWKAELQGYKIMVDHDILLHHQTTGNLKKIFGKGIDSPNRLYYVYRNIIISLKRYSDSFSFSFGWYKHLFVKAVFQLIFAGDKKERCRMIFKGVWHGIKGKSGKYLF